MLWSVLSYLLAVSAGALLAVDPPSYTRYYAEGLLKLPYAELSEPFMVYYDFNNTRSKISFYNEMAVSIQRGDQDTPASYSVFYFTNETVMNKRMCWKQPGPVSPQSLIPDLKNFTLFETNVPFTSEGTTFNGTVDIWQNIDIKFKRKNTYRFYVKSNTTDPLRYEMFGYDTLIGSHYDKYYVDYTYFNTTKKFSDANFDLPEDVKGKCVSPPDMDSSETHTKMNPMREYINNQDKHIHEMFEDFKTTHRKKYMSVKEHEIRKKHFRHNVRFIHSKNRAGLGFSLAVNHMADQSSKELRRRRGRLYKPGYNGGAPFQKENYAGYKLPESVDWRLYGAVTQVKDQATCGSCWSFGTTGTIEGTIFIQTGHLVRLSQQELVDCSWGEGNDGCDGGDDFLAYRWIKKHGLASEESYGPYMGQNSKCHYNTTKPVLKTLSGWVNVTSGDLDALKLALAKNGPISVSIDASHKSFSFYSNGVYYEEKCGNTREKLDHSVLAVGYGIFNGQAYWLVKNSWSTYWGNSGYVLMSQKKNNCGVATMPTFVKL